MKDGYLENVEEFMSYILHVSSSTKKSIMGCSLLLGQNSSFSNQEMILRSTLHKTTLICSTLTKEIMGFIEEWFHTLNSNYSKSRYKRM